MNVCGKDNGLILREPTYSLKKLFEGFQRDVIKRKLPLKKSIFTD